MTPRDRADAAAPARSAAILAAALVAAAGLVPAVPAVALPGGARASASLSAAAPSGTGPAAMSRTASAAPFAPSKVVRSLADVSGLNLPGLTSAPEPGLVRHIRLWDSGVTWAQVEKRPGVYDWSRLDAFVEWTERTGASLMLVIGPGPKFYSRTATPLAAVPGSSIVPPRTLTPWIRYVTAVVTRYRGRIDSYEPWNEVNLGMFYGGTPAQMAAMTRALKIVVDRLDPRAVVTSASVTPSSQYSRRLAAKHLHALAALGWPVDVHNTHVYSTIGSGVEGARLNSAWYLHMLRRLRAPGRPVWATEVNLNEPPSLPLDAEQTRAAMMRVTVDAMLLGISRVYWYAWLADMTNLPVKIWPGSPGEHVLRTWATAGRWRLAGCRPSATYLCTFRTRDGARRTLAVPDVVMSTG